MSTPEEQEALKVVDEAVRAFVAICHEGAMTTGFALVASYIDSDDGGRSTGYVGAVPHGQAFHVGLGLLDTGILKHEKLFHNS